MIQIVFINSPAHSFTLSSPSDRLYLDELQETKRELLDLVETDEMLENARGRGRGRGRGAAPPAAPPPFNPSLTWSESTLAKTFSASEDEPKIAMLMAYFMDLPAEKGGAEWYKGAITKLSRHNWADVEFDDGKAWVRWKPSERGLRWVVLVETGAL